MRKIVSNTMTDPRGGARQGKFHLVIYSRDGRLEYGPRVPECDKRETRRVRFWRGKRRSHAPVRGRMKDVYGYCHAWGCRMMKVPF